jgi:phosphoribosyl 1,2-cyclic phosphodiesterase
MFIRFWGVRGSIPCPGPQTVRYGGNTACIELRFGKDAHPVIIDAGSGIRPLGDYIMKHDLPKGPIRTEIFITHTHWDHILGFPFFTPIFVPGTKIKVFGPVTYEDESLERVIGDQLTYRYFPVRHSELAAEIKYTALKECTMDLGEGVTLRTKYLNHPILCLGYRFEHEGKAVCTAYDTEPFRNVFPTDPSAPDYDQAAAEEGELVAQEENRKLVEFFSGADILIHDSQYTYREFKAGKIGWGHSTFEHAVNTAHRAGVKKLIMFHHDPLRSDDELDRLLEEFKTRTRGKTPLEIELAREGMEIEV